MQADQTVLSLRPGGGGGNRAGSRVLGARFDTSSSDLPLLRPHGGVLPSFSFQTADSRFEGRECIQYTRDQLLQLREVGNIPEAVLRIKHEVEAEFFGEDQNWGRAESSTQIQPRNRYAEPDNRDWRGQSAQLPTSGEDRSWETIRENRESGSWSDSKQQDQLNSLFARAQISSNQGNTPSMKRTKSSTEATSPGSQQETPRTKKKKAPKTKSPKLQTASLNEQEAIPTQKSPGNMVTMTSSSKSSDGSSPNESDGKDEDETIQEKIDVENKDMEVENTSEAQETTSHTSQVHKQDKEDEKVEDNNAELPQTKVFAGEENNEENVIDVTEEDMESFYEQIVKSITHPASEASGSRTVSSVAPTSSDQLEQAKTLVREQIKLSFKAVQHSCRFHDFQKALTYLLNSEDLSDAIKVSLKHFINQLPNLRTSFDNATDEIKNIEKKINRASFVQLEMTKFASKFKAMKEETNDLKAKKITALAKIQELQEEVGRYDKGLEDKKMRQQANFQIAKSFQKELVEYNLFQPSLMNQKDLAHSKLDSLNDTWESFKNSLEGQL